MIINVRRCTHNVEYLYLSQVFLFFLSSGEGKQLFSCDCSWNSIPSISFQLLEYFVEEYFDQNPISQLGIIITKNKRAEKVSELGGWFCWSCSWISNRNLYSYFFWYGFQYIGFYIEVYKMRQEWNEFNYCKELMLI